MASSGQVVVNPDHLDGGDGTIGMALQLWSSRNGPVVYNKWQSLYFLFRRQGYTDADEPENQKGKAARIRSLYKEIQEQLHGPDHMAQAILAEAQSGA